MVIKGGVGIDGIIVITILTVMLLTDIGVITILITIQDTIMEGAIQNIGVILRFLSLGIHIQVISGRV